jgi:hypothetical protein
MFVSPYPNVSVPLFSLISPYCYRLNDRYTRQGIPEGWTVLDSSEIDDEKNLEYP